LGPVQNVTPFSILTGDSRLLQDRFRAGPITSSKSGARADRKSALFEDGKIVTAALVPEVSTPPPDRP